MGTAVTPSAGRSAARISKATAAEKNLVNAMMKISRRVLANVSPAEREERLRKLNQYLASLEGSVAKRA